MFRNSCTRLGKSFINKHAGIGQKLQNFPALLHPHASYAIKNQKPCSKFLYHWDDEEDLHKLAEVITQFIARAFISVEN